MNDPMSDAHSHDECDIGEILQNARQEREETIDYVAKMLRINWRYIKAIEDNDFDQLPGTPYAIGFIRTYADHLDLDSEPLIKKYKTIGAIAHGKASLEFPEPIRENSLPGGAILFAGLVLAGLAYGSWYLTTDEDPIVGQIDPTLKQNILDNAISS